jgi:hypothetical protein
MTDGTRWIMHLAPHLAASLTPSISPLDWVTYSVGEVM